MLFKIIEPTTIQLKFILQSASRSIIVDRLLLFWHLFYMIPTSKIWIRIWIRIRIKRIISCRLRMQTRWVRSGSNDSRSPVRVITIELISEYQKNTHFLWIQFRMYLYWISFRNSILIRIQIHIPTGSDPYEIPSNSGSGLEQSPPTDNCNTVSFYDKLFSYL